MENHNKICWIENKTYSYLIDDGREDKKVKSTKKYVKENLENLKIIKTA